MKAKGKCLKKAKAKRLLPKENLAIKILRSFKKITLTYSERKNKIKYTKKCQIYRP